MKYVNRHEISISNNVYMNMCDTSMDETYRAGLLRVDLLLFTGKLANCKIYVNE